MPHTNRTLTLDQSWDITLSGAGNLSLSSGALATAQNVANECRLFTRDAYFAYGTGIPYFLAVLGNKLPVPAFRGHLKKAALRVAGVAEVMDVSMAPLDGESRTLGGTILFRLEDGTNVSIDI